MFAVPLLVVISTPPTPDSWSPTRDSRVITGTLLMVIRTQLVITRTLSSNVRTLSAVTRGDRDDCPPRRQRDGVRGDARRAVAARQPPDRRDPPVRPCAESTTRVPREYPREYPRRTRRCSASPSRGCLATA
jgi:hypothetical protein